MFRFTLLCAVSFLVVNMTRAITEEEFMKTCGKLINHNSGHCCKIEFPHKNDEMRKEVMKECGQLPVKTPTCERELCMATKRGLASADGKIDKVKAAELLDKDFEGLPAPLISGIKEKCINGNIDMYGPADDCEVRKFGMCIHLQLANTCPEWDNAGPCEGMKEAAAGCVKLFP